MLRWRRRLRRSSAAKPSAVRVSSWGGNGILLENHIGRFVADAEAIYSYEGMREMNRLIVGKAITGLSAFV